MCLVVWWLVGREADSRAAPAAAACGKRVRDESTRLRGLHWQERKGHSYGKPKQSDLTLPHEFWPALSIVYP